MKKHRRPAAAAVPVSTPDFTPAQARVLGLWAVGVAAWFAWNHPLSGSALNAVLEILLRSRFFHAYTLQALAASLVGWAVLAVAAWLGASVITRFVPAERSPVERVALGLALGAGALAHVTLLLGSVGWWSRAVWLTVLVFYAAVAYGLSRVVRSSQAPRPVSLPPPDRLAIVALAAIGALLVYGMLTPEIFYDALHYHLAIPNQYEQAGRVISIPTMIYSNFVMNIQMLFGFAQTLGSTLSAKAVHAGLTAGLAVALIAFARSAWASSSGWMAAAMFLSMPVVVLNAVTAGTDAGGAFFLVAAVLAMFGALQNPGRRSLWLCGLLIGIAAGCKYPAFVFGPLLLILWSALRWRTAPSRRHLLGELATLTVAASVALAPVLLKNAWLHRNPLYPFFGTAVGTPRLDPAEWRAFLSDTNPRDLQALFSWQGAQDALTHLWVITMGTYGLIGPLLLMSLPLALVWVWRRRERAAVLGMAWAALLWAVWFFTSTVPRYGLPAMALLCAVAAEAATRLARQDRLSGALVRIGLGIGLLWNVTLAGLMLFGWEGWRVLGGFETEDRYLSAMHATYPTPPYAGIAWMNRELPADAVVLFVGDSRSHYLKRRAIPVSIPGRQPLVDWAKEARTGAELAQRMRQAGATHVFLNLVEAVRTDSYQIFRWDAASWAVLDDFWRRYVRLVWKQESEDSRNPQALYVYELASEEMAAVPHAAPPNPFIRWKPESRTP